MSAGSLHIGDGLVLGVLRLTEKILVLRFVWNIIRKPREFSEIISGNYEIIRVFRIISELSEIISDIFRFFILLISNSHKFEFVVTFPVTFSANNKSE